ncbi:MAG: hypothetical protein ACRCUE_20400 [Bosea sp. (in: a-proteobacteria)]
MTSLTYAAPLDFACGYSVNAVRRDALTTTNQLHPGVFLLFAGSFVWIFGIFWLTFQHQTEAAFAVAVSIVYTSMYFGVPYVCYRMANSHGLQVDAGRFGAFLRGDMITHTGRIRGWEAALQVCSIPFALVLGATGVCLAVQLT